MTVKIEGDWSAVQASVEAGARAAYEAGQLVSIHVIPKSDDGVSQILPYARFVDRYRPGEDAPPPKRVRPVKPKPPPKATVPPKVAPPVVERKPESTVASDFPMAESRSLLGTTPEVVDQVRVSAPLAETPVGAEPSWEELELMAVVKLRKYARSLSGLPIKGREISKANKQQLLAVIGVRRGRN